MSTTNDQHDANAWSEAVSELGKANAELAAFSDGVWEPAYAWGQKHGRNLTHALGDEMTRLADLRFAAERRVCGIPAPDMAAAIWKIEYAGNLVDDIQEWSELWWDSAKADLLRLAA